MLWFLRRALEDVAGVQRGLVERRIERVQEREKSALNKAPVAASAAAARAGGGGGAAGSAYEKPSYSYTPPPKPSQMTETEMAELDALSPQQLQLFAEENDTMLRHYTDTLGKVQNAEQSLLEISSLQQSLVTHLSTQEEYIGQLVTDAANTQTNIGSGNKELKRASERRSTAQAVFWGTVGLCTGLVVWDLIF